VPVLLQASVPYAMAAMGATLETNLSLAESIKDKLAQGGLEWNDENIKSVISDEKFLKDARIKAVTRGVTIGAIDALTGRVAGKVGAKLLKAPKGGLVKSAAAAGSDRSSRWIYRRSHCTRIDRTRDGHC
jgi:hypothetical protein